MKANGTATIQGYGVQISDLAVRYGSTTALEGVNLDLAPGRIHGLLGRNGTGKTTLLSVLASLRQPHTGSVLVEGQAPFEHEVLMENICLIRESGDVIGDVSAADALDFVEVARPSFDREYADRLAHSFGLDLSVKPAAMSRGQRSALGATIGLASRAELTMFDEVHLGMDAPTRQKFYDELIADFAEHPRTFIISSHLISEIEPLVETVTILKNGTLLLSEEADDLRRRGVTLTGPTALVDQAAAAQTVLGHTVVGSRDLGPTRQLTLYGDLDQRSLDEAERAGLQVGPVPLQDLFIHLTDA
ncbi:ABC transporter ATP-binding protein [Ornithinimicrobium sp. Arc0846-15]|nr:ABC transporter ATP-binding protein [Ornithinimicrobium laminariae]